MNTDITTAEFLAKIDAGKMPTFLDGCYLERAMDMQRKGLVLKTSDGWKLTEKGRERVRRLIK